MHRIVCFKSMKNNKYLRYKHDATETRSLVHFDTHDLMNPCAQFEVIPSQLGSDLVHIKCRLNNLYLVRWSRSHYWISSSANEPEEDQTSWSCTLFKVVDVEKHSRGGIIRLFHIQLGRYVRLPSNHDSGLYVSCLLADFKEPDYQNSSDLITWIPWSSLYKLPSRVAFKGQNGLYLGAQLLNGRPGLQFSFKDFEDPKVAHKITTFPDGTISVKSEYYGSYWRVGEIRNFIVVDADDRNVDTGAFRVLFNNLNNVSILSMNPTSYLKHLNSPDIGWYESFAAATPTMDNKFAQLEVVDLGPPLQESTVIPTTLTTDLPAV